MNALRSLRLTPTRVGLVFLFALFAFWALSGPTAPRQIMFDESMAVTLLDETVRVGLDDYVVLSFESTRGDILGYTVDVRDGGPIDFFILETEKKDTLIDALERREHRFTSYEQGKGLNTTGKSGELVAHASGGWHVILNNGGMIVDGARPRSEVRVHVSLRKIGERRLGWLWWG
ncbi:hypothetical protein JXL21_10670 [Candidatus Bathyarchaeota archaeon]|nr:hypothetical protein [Candidatus Bathyarchaeota archaeon]